MGWPRHVSVTHGMTRLIDSHCNVSSRAASGQITFHLLSSHLITSHHITSHRITSHLITLRHITCHHITSHQISSHLITSYHISSCMITYGPEFAHPKWLPLLFITLDPALDQNNVSYLLHEGVGFLATFNLFLYWICSFEVLGHNKQTIIFI